MTASRIFNLLFFHFYSYTLEEWLLVIACSVLGLYAILLTRR